MAVAPIHAGPERADDVSDGVREELLSVGRRWATAQRRLVQLVVMLDESRLWERDGAPNCARWVADALDVEVSTAREWLRIGRSLTQLPTIGAAFDDDRISYSKVRALTRVATPDNEAELTEIAERVPAGRLAHALATWLVRHETPDETEARQHAARAFGWRPDPDGMLAGFIRLPPAEAQALTTSIDSEVVRCRPRLDASADASERWPTIAQQRADALIRLMTTGGSALMTELVLHVRGDGCTFDDGTPIAESFMEQIAPMSFIRALIHDAEGRPINASGRQRHPTIRQQRVVTEKYRACVDCGSTEFLQFDHEPDYATSSRTLVDELRLRCWTCHRQRHARAAAARVRRRAGRS